MHSKTDTWTVARQMAFFAPADMKHELLKTLQNN